MRNPNKSRSRNKNNRRNNNSGGNALNRVHDSSGPDGRVRGTPQQVIEKYQALAHDSSLSGDRVAMENFQQHAEHYIRLTNEAQRQINERRQNAEQQQDRQGGNNNQQQQRNDQQPNAAQDPGAGDQPSAAPDVPKDVPFSDVSEKSEEAAGLVETPEAEAATKRKPARARKPRPPKAEADKGAEATAATEQPAAE